MQRILLILLILAIPLIMFANMVKFGERPFIDIYQIPDSAMEQGKLRIKLSPEFSDFLDSKEHVNGIISDFGISKLDELNQYYGVKEISKLFYSPALKNEFTWRHKEWGFNLWFELRFDSSKNVRDIIMAYRDLKGIVTWAEPEYKKVLYGSKDGFIPYVQPDMPRWTPNDPQLSSQWHYNNTGQNGGTAGADIDLFSAWNIEKGLSTVIVAVIDGGIQINHPDLAANIWSGVGYNFVDNNTTITADAHGTHVAGTVAAVTNNSVGVAGVAGGSGTEPGVSLMSCQVFTSASSGGFNLSYPYAADNGAAIAQNSWGYTNVGTYEQAVLDAIDYFNTNGGGTVLNGGITIFAAGNSGTTGQWYPGCYSGAFAVAATNNQDIRSYYSNYDTWVDVSAPGGETNTVTARGVLSTLSGSTYGYYQGTSMACPHVSGLAGLVVSYAYRNGTILTNTQLANAISSTTDNHYGVNASYIGKLGTGRINAFAALNSIIPGMPSCNITAPLNGTGYNLGDIITVNVTATDASPGSVNRVDFYLDGAVTPTYTDSSSPYSWAWNSTGSSTGNHTIVAKAVDNENNVASDQVTFILLAPANEGFETGNFSAYAWVQSGNLPWTVQSLVKYSGTYAAKSGAIADSQTSSMAVTLNITTAGNITFYQKTSSESGYDFLTFYIDSVQQGQWSGEVGWALQSYAVTTGIHEFKWTYSKDTNTIGGSDCAYLDHIAFPPYNLSLVYPPRNLTAVPSHAKVALTWQAPSSGSPSSYNLFRNSSLLTNIAALNYNDTAVTNGSSYSYYVTAVYTSPAGESSPTSTVNATPISLPPTGLSGLAGNNTVTLNWTAPAAGTPSGYKIYRNSVYLGAATLLTYTDNTAANGTTYSYYVTATYTSPTGESAASNTVSATPSIITLVTIGAGTTTQRQPFGMYWGYERSASLYLSSEIGTTGIIESFNWYVGTGQTTAAPVTIYLKTTTATTMTASTWATMITGATTVYPATSQSFSTTGWKTITLTTPFTYTGTNLLVMVETNYGGSGTTTYPYFRYTTSTSGLHQYWATDSTPPTVAGTLNTYRPNIQMNIGPLPTFSLSPTSLAYGNVNTGSTSAQTFTITNTGGGTLTGNITTPTGFTVALSARSMNNDRNVLAYSITAFQSKTYSLTFAPTAVQSYNGTVTITSNDAGHLSNNLTVTGSGINPVPIITVDPVSIAYGTVLINTTPSNTFTIANTGTAILSGTITTPVGYTVSAARTNVTELDVEKNSFSSLNSANNSEQRNTLSYTVAIGGTNTYNLVFAPVAVQAYNGNVTIAHNAGGADKTIALTGQGGKPTIGLSSTTFTANLAPGQTDSQSLTLSNSGNMALNYTMTISGTPAWLTINSGTTVSNSIAVSGAAQNITITCNSAGMSAGTYNATINGTSNDPGSLTYSVSVALTVTNPEPPSVPLHITITANMTTEDVTVSWEAATGNPTGYKIYKSSSPAFIAEETFLIGIKSSAETSIIVPTDAAPSAAFIRVVAYRD